MLSCRDKQGGGCAPVFNECIIFTSIITIKSRMEDFIKDAPIISNVIQVSVNSKAQAPLPECHQHIEFCKTHFWNKMPQSIQFL